LRRNAASAQKGGAQEKRKGATHAHSRVSPRKEARVLTPEWTFLAFAAVFGLCFALITPPFQVADEFEHFHHSYLVSGGHVLPVAGPSGTRGVMVPTAIIEMSAPFYSVPFHPERRVESQALLKEFTRPNGNGEAKWQKLKSTAGVSPIAYLPQAIGIALGRLLRAPAVLLVYLGRLGNLACWAALVFLAIRTTPTFRWGFVVISLLPISLFQAASNSYDALTNGVAFLFAGLVFSARWNEAEAVGRRQVMILAGVALLLSQCKPVYALLALLALLLPIRKFASSWAWLRSVAVIVGAGCGGAVLWTLVAKANHLELMGLLSNDAVPGRQMSLLLSQPHVFVQALWTAMWTFEYSSIVGKLGWLDTPLPSYAIYVGALLIAGVAVLDHDRSDSVRWFDRAIAAGVALVVTTAVSLALYLSWTPVGGRIVYGLQGRYFIALMPLLGVLLHNQRFGPLGRWGRIALLVGVATLLGASVHALVARYYLFSG
jgi:hypothetical protein